MSTETMSTKQLYELHMWDPENPIDTWDLATVSIGVGRAWGELDDARACLANGLVYRIRPFGSFVAGEPGSDESAFDVVATVPIVRYCIVYPSTGETDLFLYTSRVDAERAAEGLDDPLEIPYVIVEVKL